jgi:hypothetical protein
MYFTHGLSHIPEYRVWAQIKERCENPRNEWYWCYGGKGVSVCERWKHSFKNFISDMGRRPSSRHSIDRFPDNNGNYEPGNCRWATWSQQLSNRRTRTHCLRGHELTPENTRLQEYKGKIRRACLVCVRSWQRKYYADHPEKWDRYWVGGRRNKD